MMWSCTVTLSGFATSTITRVISMSARDGVGSPPMIVHENYGFVHHIEQKMIFVSATAGPSASGNDVADETLCLLSDPHYEA